MTVTRTYPALTRAEFEDGSPYTYEGVVFCEDEDGQYVYAYGHVDPVLYAAAVSQFDRENGAHPDDEYLPEDVQHCWAVTREPASSADGWWIQWGPLDEQPITSQTPNAFALTVVTR